MSHAPHHVPPQAPALDPGAATVITAPPAPGEADGVTVLWLVGDLDLATAPDVGRLLSRSVQEGRTGGVTVDLSRVTFMDVAGLRTLLALRSVLAQDDRGLVLRAPSRQVRLVLRASGLTSLFTVVLRPGSPPRPPPIPEQHAPLLAVPPDAGLRPG